DIYAFACVCHEINTGKVPFHELQNDMAVMMKVAGGHRPPRPKSCSGTPALDALWELMQNCWDEKPEMRPTASGIVKRLAGPVIEAKTTPFSLDWDDQFTSKFRRSLQPQPLLPSVIHIERILFGDGSFIILSSTHIYSELVIQRLPKVELFQPGKYILYLLLT
ncbi:hypothetical protein K438DRAFT_1557721, partial [Mycena galopus ATCC 62051]